MMTSGGALNTRQTYYPYGAERVHDGSAFPTGMDYTFTGQKNDATTGLMYYGARYYDTTLGRFTQADTIVPNPFNPQALNRYAYTLNNPVRYTDPTGHVSCGDEDPECGGGGGGPGGGDPNPDDGNENTGDNNKIGDPQLPVDTGANQGGCTWHCHHDDDTNGGKKLLIGANAGTGGGAGRAYAMPPTSKPDRGVEYEGGSSSGGFRGFLCGLFGLFCESAESAASEVAGGESAQVPTSSVRPSWIKDGNTVASWAKQLEGAYKQTQTVPDSQTVDELVQSARDYGVNIRLDAGHTDPNPWTMPHLNVGDQGYHVVVPPDYVLPP